jgi:putative endonuclease
MNRILSKARAAPSGLKSGPALASGTTTERGKSAEDRALAFLVAQGLKPVARNYKTPGRGGGEIDLIMQDPAGTLVFVEVRQRGSSAFGGAAASVSVTKQRRLVFAAHRYLMRFTHLPACRFDVLTVEQDITWIQAAFDAASFYRG